MNFTIKRNHNKFVVGMQLGDILYDDACDYCGNQKYCIIDMDPENFGDYHLCCVVCNAKVLLLTNKKSCERIKNILPFKKNTEYAFCYNCINRKLMLINFTPKKTYECVDCGYKIE